MLSLSNITIRISCSFFYLFLGFAGFATELKVNHPDFSVSLLAEAPQIVTPIGAAVDSKDRLFVVESHTHHPGPGYPGPKSDRIKIFDTSGKAEPKIFSEGFAAAMNLAFSPDGGLYVICAGEMWRLMDLDRDDNPEQRTKIVELITTDRYAHSRLLGVTFGPDGFLYFSRGNTGGHKYTIRGRDGSTVSGYGDGGNIVRCRPDGTKLELFATGFWNLFDLKHDSAGRLLAVDNDPDARGPNRLLHIVQHGDYGYKSLYGGAGNHPFQGWDGDVPGTLPYISGTGEAPSGLLDCSKLPFPTGFERSILVTIWGENTIEKHDLSSKGLSLAGNSSVFVSGDSSFRPVAIVPDSKGNLYVTDWVKVDYPNHGEGRIWKITPKKFQRQVAESSARFSPPAFSTLKELLEALQSPDPFARHAATINLSLGSAEKFRKDENAFVRLGALLALRREGRAQYLPEFLSDPDIKVRQAALIWAGESGQPALRAQLDSSLAREKVSARLFATYLAAVESLDPEFVRDFKAQKFDSAKALKRKLEPGFIERIITDQSRPVAVRAIAVANMETVDTAAGREIVIRLAKSAPEAIRLAAIEKLAQTREADARPDLLQIASDESNSVEVRTAAVASLSWYHLPEPEKLLPLLAEPALQLQLQTLHALRLYLEAAKVKEAFENLHRSENTPPRVRTEVDYLLGREKSRPESFQGWLETLSSGGDPANGRRMFFSPLAACSTCHTVEGRGGKVGPDLSHISQSLDREKLIRGTLRPNELFAPQWQAWIVETTAEETYSGIQADVNGDGSITMFLSSGRWHTIPGKDVLKVYASRNSIMPEGLEAGLSTDGLRDLIAYLSSLN